MLDKNCTMTMAMFYTLEIKLNGLVKIPSKLIKVEEGQCIRDIIQSNYEITTEKIEFIHVGSTDSSDLIMQYFFLSSCLEYRYRVVKNTVDFYYFDVLYFVILTYIKVILFALSITL